MAKFSIVVAHGLVQGEALRRIRNEIENIKRQHGDKISGFRENWNNEKYAFAGTAKGFTVSGVMTVNPSQVEIVMNLPWLAIPFKGRIEADIREQLSVLLA
jgi:hypothetical protein